MANVHGVVQIQGTHQLGHVGGIGVHVVAGIGLVRPTVTATVMGDHAITPGQEEQHLVVPVIGTERPTRSEEHTSELQSLMRISYAVFCLQKKITKTKQHT